jgi:hypothetical protein
MRTRSHSDGRAGTACPGGVPSRRPSALDASAAELPDPGRRCALPHGAEPIDRRCGEGDGQPRWAAARWAGLDRRHLAHSSSCGADPEPGAAERAEAEVPGVARGRIAGIEVQGVACIGDLVAAAADPDRAEQRAVHAVPGCGLALDGERRPYLGAPRDRHTCVAVPAVAREYVQRYAGARLKQLAGSGPPQLDRLPPASAGVAKLALAATASTATIVLTLIVTSGSAVAFRSPPHSCSRPGRQRHRAVRTATPCGSGTDSSAVSRPFENWPPLSAWRGTRSILGDRGGAPGAHGP